jgi:phosphoribosyl-ATP pyrophosphohydrolase
MSDSLDRLYAAVLAARDLDPAVSRTSRLLRSGQAKMSKKLAEEAIEVVIDAMNGEADAVVRESADLIYNLAVLWVSCGVKPRDVWAEMDRREKMLGIAEKLPKAQRKEVPAREARSGTADMRGVIALRARRAAKRR